MCSSLVEHWTKLGSRKVDLPKVELDLLSDYKQIQISSSTINDDSTTAMMRTVIGKVKEGGAKYIETKASCCCKKSVSDENAARKSISGALLEEKLCLNCSS